MQMQVPRMHAGFSWLHVAAVDVLLLFSARFPPFPHQLVFHNVFRMSDVSSRLQQIRLATRKKLQGRRMWARGECDRERRLTWKDEISAQTTSLPICYKFQQQTLHYERRSRCERHNFHYFSSFLLLPYLVISLPLHNLPSSRSAIVQTSFAREKSIFVLLTFSRLLCK